MIDLFLKIYIKYPNLLPEGMTIDACVNLKLC